MSNIITLVKTELKNYFNLMTANMGVGKKKELAIILVLFLVVSFVIMGAQLSNVLYQGFAEIGSPELSFAVILLMASLMVLFLSFGSIINLIYYSKNTGFLLTLPITENAIVLSKLAVQYVYSFVLSSAIIIPSLWIYLTNTGWSIVGILGSILVIILAPIAPLIIATLLIILLMRVTGKAISRRTISVLVNILLFVFILGSQAMIVRQTMASDFIVNMMLDEKGLLYFLGLRFPPIVWATEMVAGSVTSLILYLVLNIALLLVVSVISGPLVSKALKEYNQAEATSKVQKATYRGRSVINALVRRNLLIIIKTPAFLMNSIMLILLPFIIVGVNMLTGAQSLEAWESIIGTLAQAQWQPFIPLIWGGFLIVPAVMGTFSATAISREGKFLWQSKVAPVSATQDIIARLISCAVLIGLGMVVLITVGLIVLPLNFTGFMWGILLSIPAVYAILTIDMIIDISRPILNWTSAIQAIKNNMNIMVALAWKVLVGIVIFIFIKVLNSVIPIEGYKYLVFAIMCVLAVAGHYMLKKAIKQYAALEIK